MSFTRREFLQSGALAGAGLFSGLSLSDAFAGAAKKAAGAAGAAVPDLVVARGPSPAKNCLAAVDALGGFTRFVHTGDKVVIKPNPVGSNPPERAVNTHPEMIEAVVGGCLRAGAREVIVLSHDGAPYFEANGTTAAVTRAGGSVKALGAPDQFRRILVPRGLVLPSVEIANDLRDAEVFINMPIVKHHAGSRVTCSMKNLMGVIWDRNRFHQTDLHRCIGELTSAVPHSLIIVDANHVLLTNGPVGPGRVLAAGQVIAGIDPVAIDAFATKRFFDLDPEAVPHIRTAYELGAGEIDRSKITIKEFDA